MAIVAGVLLGVYLLGIVYALLAPTKGPDPQRGQAVGCLMIVAMGLVGIGALLGAAVAFDIGWLATAISWVVIFPTALMLANGVYFLFLKFTRGGT